MMMPARVLVAAVALHMATALDLTWLPSDPHGPLPMSKKFLDKLHTLCQIQKLPPSITESDKRKIGIMCGQLQRSGYDPDGNIGSGFSDGGVSLPGVVFAVVVVAFLVYQFYWKPSHARGSGGGHRLGGGGASERSPRDREHLRERRLKRYATKEYPPATESRHRPLKRYPTKEYPEPSASQSRHGPLKRYPTKEYPKDVNSEPLPNAWGQN